MLTNNSCIIELSPEKQSLLDSYAYDTFLPVGCDEYNEMKQKMADMTYDEACGYIGACRDWYCVCQASHEADPIGFSDANNKYDFFVDKDNNGDLSNENEFLGASNGWQEMVDLDVDGNGSITSDEMKDLKIAVTNKDGSQEIKNANEIFKEGDSIDLSSYQTKNTTMENGNQLLGEFSINLDGKKIDTGYNTLDNIDWLKENYDFSDYKDENISNIENKNINLINNPDPTYLNNKIKANQRKADNEIEEAQKAIKKSTSYKLDKDIEEVFNKKIMELQEQAQKALDEVQKEDEENEKDKKNNPFK